MKDLRTELYFDAEQETSLKEIKDLANTLLGLTWTITVNKYVDPKEVNLKSSGWIFKFNDTKNAAGYCDYGKKIIYISTHLLNQNLNRSLDWEDTVRHELAHAVDVELRGTSDHSSIIIRRFLSGTSPSTLKSNRRAKHSTIHFLSEQLSSATSPGSAYCHTGYRGRSSPGFRPSKNKKKGT